MQDRELQIANLQNLSSCDPEDSVCRTRERGHRCAIRSMAVGGNSEKYISILAWLVAFVLPISLLCICLTAATAPAGADSHFSQSDVEQLLREARSDRDYAESRQNHAREWRVRAERSRINARDSKNAKNEHDWR